MNLHHPPARAGTVHWGYFSASQAPALHVQSSDFIRAGAITHHAGDAPDLPMDADISALYVAIPEDDRAPGVHIMTGPIHMDDAMPGDMARSAAPRSKCRSTCCSGCASARISTSRRPCWKRHATRSYTASMRI